MTGCASPTTGWTTSNGAGGSPGVFRTPMVAAYDRSPGAPLEVERFEYSRRDGELNPVGYGPVVSAYQWPQAPKPAERRIIFHLWEQR